MTTIGDWVIYTEARGVCRCIDLAKTESSVGVKGWADEDVVLFATC